jgi:hypothetical protein
MIHEILDLEPDSTTALAFRHCGITTYESLISLRIDQIKELHYKVQDQAQVENVYLRPGEENVYLNIGEIGSLKCFIAWLMCIVIPANEGELSHEIVLKLTYFDFYDFRISSYPPPTRLLADMYTPSNYPVKSTVTIPKPSMSSDKEMDDCLVVRGATAMPTSRENARVEPTETVETIFFKNEFFAQGSFGFADIRTKKRPTLDVEASNELQSYRACYPTTVYSLMPTDLTKMRDAICEARNTISNLLDPILVKFDFTPSVMVSYKTLVECLKGYKGVRYEVDSFNQATSTFADSAEFTNPREIETSQTRDQLEPVLTCTSIVHRETEATMSLEESTSGCSFVVSTSVFTEGSKIAKLERTFAVTSRCTNRTILGKLNAPIEYVYRQDQRVQQIIRKHTKFYGTGNLLRPDCNKQFIRKHIKIFDQRPLITQQVLGRLILGPRVAYLSVGMDINADYEERVASAKGLISTVNSR